ncbi:hypothetical protein BDF20DRAFT_836117 [Mycotypha africana]|uniref:uncharacterized protein n=1 Tax=Mycotypha africana TaxID=64632 RepID=UPI002301C8E7|nr:uncharacterized protein BDF20DRAFT_836117 [Mycotypha africana]KAI8977299.1 hypothetical protein BDF20DRAFT_836117 [Mycotypha africana]
MPFIKPPKHYSNPTESERYKVVDEILAAPDYYRILGVTRNASTEEIRRAYIKKSRICHPDKFVPAYPLATESFQLLSIAYETLSNPSSKLLYDLSNHKQRSATTATGCRYSTFAAAAKSEDEEVNANQTLQRVLHQLFIEMLEGEFETMRAFIYALNGTNPGIHITDDTIAQIELGFRKMRKLVLSIQFELMKLYELQHELRSLSYFSLWKRMGLSITICRILLQLPIIINTEVKQKQSRAVDEERQERQGSIGSPSSATTATKNKEGLGILNSRIEGALQIAVQLLEASEKYVKACRSHTYPGPESIAESSLVILEYAQTLKDTGDPSFSVSAREDLAAG